MIGTSINIVIDGAARIRTLSLQRDERKRCGDFGMCRPRFAGNESDLIEARYNSRVAPFARCSVVAEHAPRTNGCVNRFAKRQAERNTLRRDRPAPTCRAAIEAAGASEFVATSDLRGSVFKTRTVAYEFVARVEGVR